MGSAKLNKTETKTNKKWQNILISELTTCHNITANCNTILFFLAKHHCPRIE